MNKKDTLKIDLCRQKTMRGAIRGDKARQLGSHLGYLLHGNLYHLSASHALAWLSRFTEPSRAPWD